MHVKVTIKLNPETQSVLERLADALKVLAHAAEDKEDTEDTESIDLDRLIAALFEAGNGGVVQ